MTSNPPLTHNLAGLAELSRRLGRNKAYVQGGGGNTSLKLDDGTMWVKASGLALADLTPESGFVRVHTLPIRQGLRTVTTEAAYRALVADSLCEKSPASPHPSMESGFHAVLGTVVLHTHAVWANLLSCAAKGESLLAAIAPGAIWVPYATPGLLITHAVAARLPASVGTKIILLQNHGIIVSADTVAEAWQAHEAIHADIRRHFALTESYPAGVSVDSNRAHLLFPDQAVYLEHAELKESPAGRETLAAYEFLRHTLSTLGLTPHYLPESEVATLLGMEAEKYRQKVARA